MLEATIDGTQLIKVIDKIDKSASYYLQEEQATTSIRGIDFGP